MRQLRILTKANETAQQQQLEPGVHGGLYNIPEIRDARAYIRDNKSVGMICIVIGNRYYSIIVINEDELQEGHFEIQ